MIKLKSLLIEKLKDTDSIWDPNGPMNRDIILTALKKDRKIMKHVGKADEDMYWDDVDLVAGGDSGETIATMKRNMTYGKFKNAILKAKPKKWQEQVEKLTESTDVFDYNEMVIEEMQDEVNGYTKSWLKNNRIMEESYAYKVLKKYDKLLAVLMKKCDKELQRF